MASPLEALHVRATVASTIPAACFDICNSAYLEAQARGKVPALCAPDSLFRKYYQGCNDCIEANSVQTSTARQYIESPFAQYLDFCDAVSNTETQPLTTIPTSWLTWHGTFEPTIVTLLLSSGESTPQTTAYYMSYNITSTRPAYFFHVSASSLISMYIPAPVFSELAASVASAASAASVTGDASSLVYAALEDTSRPPWFASAVPSTFAAQMSTLEASINELRATPVSTASSTATTPTQETTQQTTPAGPGSPNKAWIAGAVVGSVAGAALILLSIFLVLRHKRRTAQADEQSEPVKESTYMTGGKPELHSDPAPPPQRVYEMDASQNLSEMAVHERPQELHAEQVNESAGRPD
ncbi:hypothetical protein Daus18300_010825 [Diaporthe australafricana]|uniref:LPXTG-domain-containing protein n=1 Tax=Diaporthe australafricana TaxID=127596 RepID=A0ABR3W8X2_9PEZI